MGFPNNLTFVHKQNSCKKQRKKKGSVRLEFTVSDS